MAQCKSTTYSDLLSGSTPKSGDYSFHIMFSGGSHLVASLFSIVFWSFDPKMLNLGEVHDAKGPRLHLLCWALGGALRSTDAWDSYEPGGKSSQEKVQAADQNLFGWSCLIGNLQEKHGCNLWLLVAPSSRKCRIIQIRSRHKEQHIQFISIQNANMNLNNKIQI